jgi:hypothetical protein
MKTLYTTVEKLIFFIVGFFVIHSIYFWEQNFSNILNGGHLDLVQRTLILLWLPFESAGFSAFMIFLLAFAPAQVTADPQFNAYIHDFYAVLGKDVLLFAIVIIAIFFFERTKQRLSMSVLFYALLLPTIWMIVQISLASITL